jgi:hypothetical protein
MALEAVKEKYIPKNNSFYRNNYHYFFYVMIAIFILLLLVVGQVQYQVANRPKPEFFAKQADGKSKSLRSFNDPNLLPETIIRFASKAAVLAYSFDFVNYNDQLPLARPFFTEAGWSGFKTSINYLVNSVIKNKLFVSGVVSGAPVIASQGPLPGVEYAWQVQIPFLVTYQNDSSVTQRNYIAAITVVRVPTSVNPQGIGIDQFVTG